MAIISGLPTGRNIDVDTELNVTSTNPISNSAVAQALGIELIETLSIGETTLTFTNDAITTTSTVHIYTSIYGISPVSVTVEDGNIALVFKPQESDMDVKVVVR